MNKDTYEDPKCADLAAELKLPFWSVVGLVESLFQFTAKHAPAGNIGTFKDAQIARGIRYDEDSKTLIDALVATEWLQVSDSHRLIVVDWPCQCDPYIHTRLALRREFFASGEVPKTTRLDRRARKLIEAHFKNEEPENEDLDEPARVAPPPTSFEAVPPNPSTSTDPLYTDNQFAGLVYEHYPRKVGRPKAIEHIAARLKTLESAEAKWAETDRLIALVKIYADSNGVKAGRAIDASEFFEYHLDDDPLDWQEPIIPRVKAAPL